MSAATEARSARARATIAANIIMRTKGCDFRRNFDDCFEMNDGDEVARLLAIRARTDREFAWHVLRHWHDSKTLGPTDWWLSQAAGELLGTWSYWIREERCGRCPDNAAETVHTRSFGRERLCRECAVAVRDDGQEVPGELFARTKSRTA